MAVLELEKTFLAKAIPAGLFECEFKEIIDIYIPAHEAHPKLRLRKNGGKYELTKKTPVQEGDASQQIEQTIVLNEAEFLALASLEGKKVHKLRYYYDYNGQTAEVDVFQGDLSGLVVVDFEFDDVAKLQSFEIPDFCLADVTQEDFIAGGKLCGKNYSDITIELDRFGYKKL